VKVLIAEDDLVPRRLLQRALTDWGYEVVAACDGDEAWQILQQPDAPKLALLDWVMPRLEGVEVCRKVRAHPTPQPTYLILLTGRSGKEDIVAGLRSGANDYVTKPFDRGELQARLAVGRSVVELQRTLAERIHELERALAEVKQLQGLLPICCYCKKIRGDQNYWDEVDAYLVKHSEVRFSHGICPDCSQTKVQRQLQPSLAVPGDVHLP
jgi:CheY-like chemotaxis protein